MTEEEIFEEAIRFEENQARDAFLAGACGNDEAKRERIQRLVRSYFASHDLLDPITISSVPQAGLTGEIRRQIDPDFPNPEFQIEYLGDYEVIEEIARGGMGVVFKARQKNLDRIVALKMILPGQLPTDEAEQRFHLETEAAAQLDHPGIVPLYEVGEFEGKHYFTMAYIEGESLAAKLSQEPMAPVQAAELVAQIADAVQYAHERGIVHRDLKPANVLIDSQSRPRVTDFGIAKRLNRQTDLTYTGQILGSPSYMAPEQASSKFDDISEKADIYSLGAILFAALTGRAPFEADSPFQLLKKVVEEKATSPAQFVPGIPKDLETIVLKALEKNPRDRFRSAKEFSEELTRFLNGEPIRSRGQRFFSRIFDSKFDFATIPEFLLLMLGVLLVVLALHQQFFDSRYVDTRNPIHYYPICASIILCVSAFGAYCYGASQWKCLTWAGILGCFAFGFLFIWAKYLKPEFAVFDGTIWMYGIPGCLMLTITGFAAKMRSKPGIENYQPWSGESLIHLIVITLLGISIFTPFMFRNIDETETRYRLLSSDRTVNMKIQYDSAFSIRNHVKFRYWLLFPLLASTCVICGKRKRLLAIVFALIFILALFATVYQDLAFLWNGSGFIKSKSATFRWLYSAALGLLFLIAVWAIHLPKDSSLKKLLLRFSGYKDKAPGKAKAPTKNAGD